MEGLVSKGINLSELSLKWYACRRLYGKYNIKKTLDIMDMQHTYFCHKHVICCYIKWRLHEKDDTLIPSEVMCI